MFANLKKLLTVALAAGALATGTLAVTGEASARGFHGGRHFHGGHHGHHGHWHFKRFYGFYNYNPCYWVRKPWGLVKVCPSYY